MKTKTFLIIILIFALPANIFASQISFKGGFTRVTLQGDDKQMELSGGAFAETEKIEINADKISLYGEDYRYVNCEGNIKAVEKEHKIEISCTEIFYDRDDGSVISNGWIEINDPENEAILEGAWFDFNLNERIMVLQIKAKITQITNKGLLECKADSIEYNADAQTLSLRGNASVTWGKDKYAASYITVDINTEEVTMQGSITGEING